MKTIILAQLLILWACIASLSAFAKNETTPGVTDTELTIGQSAPFSGASAGLGYEIWKGAQIYFNKINSIGGVKGRKIKVIALDDQYNGDLAQANTIKLIAKDNVFSLFNYVGTPTIIKALPVMQKFQSENIFLFSNLTGAEPQRNPPHSSYVFNIRPSYMEETQGLVDNFVKIGVKKIGVFIQDDAYGRSGAFGVNQALRKHGLKTLAEATYHRGNSFEVSMEKQARVLKEADVEAVIVIGSYAACAAFVRDARNNGYTAWIANISVGPLNLLELLQREEKRTGNVYTSRLINSNIVPLYTDRIIPLVREYHEAVEAFSPDNTGPLNDKSYIPLKKDFTGLEGYLNAKIFVDILKRTKEPLTRKGFIQTAESTKNLNVGLEEKISFSPQNHNALKKIYYMTIKNGKFVDLKNWKELQ